MDESRYGSRQDKAHQALSLLIGWMQSADEHKPFTVENLYLYDGAEWEASIILKKLENGPITQARELLRLKELADEHG